MDRSSELRGMTSFRWFLAAHAEELPAGLLLALGDGRDIENRDADDLINRIRELSREHIDQLCSAIESIHRSYFGTMNGRELSAFLHWLAGEDSTVRK